MPWGFNNKWKDKGAMRSTVVLIVVEMIDQVAGRQGLGGKIRAWREDKGLAGRQELEGKTRAWREKLRQELGGKTRAWREDKGMAGRQGLGGKTRTWREDKSLAESRMQVWHTKKRDNIRVM